MLRYQAVTSPADSTGRVACVEWSPALGLLVAGCAPFSFTATPTTKTIMTSPDGLNWTFRTLAPMTTGAIVGIAWAPALGIFAACGGNVGASGANSDQVWTSPDGINWTARGLPAGHDHSASNIVWSPGLGLFVLTGGQDTSSGIFGKMIHTSPDGITWTLRTTPFDATDRICEQICWSPARSLFLAAFSARPGHSTGILTSPDGITWTEQTTPLDVDEVFFYGATWNATLGKFVVALDGFGFQESATGTGGWTTHVPPLDLGAQIVSAAGLVIMPGFSSDVVEWPGSGAGSGQNLAGLTTSFLSSGYSSDLDQVLLVGIDAGTPAIWASVPDPATGAGDGACTVATLHGTLTPNTPGSDAVSWYFEWGTTTGYGNTTAGGSGGGLAAGAVQDTITGLTPGVTYHYRLTAVHRAFTVHGSDQSFTQGVCGGARTYITLV